MFRAHLSETALSDNLEKIKGIDGKRIVLGFACISFAKPVHLWCAYQLLLVGYLDVDLARAASEGVPLVFDTLKPK